MLSTIHPTARTELRALLPEVDAPVRELDSRIRLRLEQRKHLAERCKPSLNRAGRISDDREEQSPASASHSFRSSSAALTTLNRSRFGNRGSPARRAHMATGTSTTNG